SELSLSGTTLEQTQERARLEIETALARYEQARAAVAQLEASPVDEDVARVEHQFEAGLASIVEVYVARVDALRSAQNLAEARYNLCLAAAELGQAPAIELAALLP